MKNVILNRKNDYVAFINAIKVKVNNEEFKLYPGTELTIDVENECREIVVEIKYLIFWRKYVYKTDSSLLSVTISPTVTNKVLIFSMSAFFGLLFFYLKVESEISELLFKLYGVTLVAMFFLISTVGGKYFYKAQLK